MEATAVKRKLRISKVTLRQDGILRIDISANELFNLEDAKQVVEEAGRIGGGKVMANLIVIGADTTADSEARAYASSEIGSIYKIADAMVISSISQKIVANAYLKFNKPVRPTKFFTNEVTALKWLRQQLTEHNAEQGLLKQVKSS